jgi:hypothetical protein
MGDVIDLASRRPQVAVHLSEVSPDADLASWVTQYEDGSISVCWSEGPQEPDRGILFTREQARALGQALTDAAK